MRHSTWRVASAWSVTEKRRFASLRDIARPAPWLQDSNDSAFPLPRTMNDRERAGLRKYLARFRLDFASLRADGA